MEFGKLSGFKIFLICCAIIIFVVMAISVFVFCEAKEAQPTGLNYIIETSKQEGTFETALDIAGLSEVPEKSCVEKISNEIGKVLGGKS